MQFKNQSKQKAITFSYDDGVLQDIRFIELLNKYNLKCTFNLNSELLGKPGLTSINGQRIAHYKIAPEDVKFIYEGHEISAHTLTHPNLTTLTKEEIIAPEYWCKLEEFLALISNKEDIFYGTNAEVLL